MNFENVTNVLVCFSKGKLVCYVFHLHGVHTEENLEFNTPYGDSINYGREIAMEHKCKLVVLRKDGTIRSVDSFLVVEAN